MLVPCDESSRLKIYPTLFLLSFLAWKDIHLTQTFKQKRSRNEKCSNSKWGSLPCVLKNSIYIQISSRWYVDVSFVFLINIGLVRVPSQSPGNQESRTQQPEEKKYGKIEDWFCFSKGFLAGAQEFQGTVSEAYTLQSISSDVQLICKRGLYINAHDTFLNVHNHCLFIFQNLVSSTVQLNDFTWFSQIKNGLYIHESNTSPTEAFL